MAMVDMGTFFIWKLQSLLLSSGLFSLCKRVRLCMISPMERTKQEALYSMIQGFAGEWWNGSGLYPDPCGWTPIQVFDYFLLLPLTCKKFDTPGSIPATNPLTLKSVIRKIMKERL